MNRAEAIALATNLSAQNAISAGTQAIAYVHNDRIVFDLTHARPGRTPHSLDFAASDSDRILAHWRGYVEARS